MYRIVIGIAVLAWAAGLSGDSDSGSRWSAISRKRESHYKSKASPSHYETLTEAPSQEAIFLMSNVIAAALRGASRARRGC